MMPFRLRILPKRILSARILFERRLLCPIWICFWLASCVVLAATSSFGSDDFLDSLDQIQPDSTERPQEPQVTVPDSLDTYLESQKNGLLASASDEASLSEMIRWLILKNLPPTYENNKGWGKQKDVYDGFRFRREGMKVETYRKYKTVKHGTWKRYYLELIEPESKLKVRISDLRNIANNRLGFHLTIESPLKVFGRISQWHRDVQLISLSTNATADVQVDIDAEVGILVNPLLFPPDMHFSPTVTKASVRLTKMDVDRISHIRGDLAEELGKGLRKFVDDYLVEYDDKLVSKINKQLEKQKEKLHISTGDYLPGLHKKTP